MITLNSGEVAPGFAVKDVNGTPVSLSEYQGKKVLLTFFRYASCPFCTVRFVRMTQEVERYAQQGIQVIGVFESSPEYIKEYLGPRGLPFPVIPDPQGELYARYGIRKSLPGLMFGMFRMPTLLLRCSIRSTAWPNPMVISHVFPLTSLSPRTKLLPIATTAAISVITSRLSVSMSLPGRR